MNDIFDLKAKMVGFAGMPSSWNSLYSDEALLTRDWKHVSAHGVNAYVNEDETKAEVWHDNGSFIAIERDGSTTVITDESDRTVIASKEMGPRRVGRHRAKIEKVNSDHEAGLDGEDVASINLSNLGVRVGFDVNNRQKIVFLPDHSGLKVTFAKATTPKHRPEVRTRFLHAIDIQPRHEMWGGHSPLDVMRAGILVPAIDLGLEPGLRVFNAVEMKGGSVANFFQHHDDGSEEYEFMEMPRWQSAEDRGPAPKLLSEVPWNNETAEFSGYGWHTPRKFGVEALGKGNFRICVELDHREGILSQGAMLRSVLNQSPSAVSYNPKRGQPGNLLRLLKGGAEIGNHRDQPWRYVVVKASKAGETALHIRTILKDNFGLSGKHAGAISIAKNLVVVGMDRRAHEVALDAQLATQEVIAAINTGDIGGQKPFEFLRDRFKRGADLRRVDAQEADGGKRTLAARMREQERYELLAAMRDLGGIGADMIIEVA